MAYDQTCDMHMFVANIELLDMIIELEILATRAIKFILSVLKKNAMSYAVTKDFQLAKIK